MLYGFAILWIMPFHMWTNCGVRWAFGQSWLSGFAHTIQVGRVGVELFLLLSGISLYFSFQKSQEVYPFLKRRFARVIPTTLALAIPYWIFRYVFMTGVIAKIPAQLTLLLFWITGDHSIWYVSFILVMYVLYPYFYGFIFAKDANPVVRTAILCAFFVLLEWSCKYWNPELYELVEVALPRIPAFLLGCLAGKYVYEKRTISILWIIAALVFVPIFVHVASQRTMEQFQLRHYYLLGGVAITLSAAFICRLLEDHLPAIFARIRRPFDFCGNISLELYVSHILIIQAIKFLPFYQRGDLLCPLAAILVSFPIAWITAKSLEPLQKRLAKS